MREEQQQPSLQGAPKYPRNIRCDRVMPHPFVKTSSVGTIRLTLSLLSEPQEKDNAAKEKLDIRRMHPNLLHRRVPPKVHYSTDSLCMRRAVGFQIQPVKQFTESALHIVLWHVVETQVPCSVSFL